MTKLGHNKGPDFDKDLSTILTLLQSKQPETLVTYQELTATVGRPIKSQDSALRAALKKLVAERIVYENIPTEGYRRMNDTEVATRRAKRIMRRPHRAAKRALKELDAVNEDNLDRSIRPTHWARRSVHQTVARLTHGNSVNSVAKREDTKHSQLTTVMSEFKYSVSQKDDAEK